MSKERSFPLDVLCTLVELPVRTVRYYIQIGLVDRPEGETRAARYTQRHLDQLLTIRKWTQAGMSLERIGEVLAAEQRSEPPLPEADHLCCGTFGRIDVERYAVEAFARVGQLSPPLETAAAVLKRAQTTARFRINPTILQNEYFPGFFQGSAGIGYSLLRLGAPKKFPNILAFE